MCGGGRRKFRALTPLPHPPLQGNQEQRIALAFASFDTDGSGDLTLPEVHQLVKMAYGMDDSAAWTAAQGMFAAMDVNRDGRLSLDEFRLGVQRTPSLLSAFLPPSQYAQPHYRGDRGRRSGRTGRRRY